MCLCQILAALACKGDNQALGNRNGGENTIGIDVDAPAVIASPSTENKGPSLVASTQSDDSSSDLKRGTQNGGETSSCNQGNNDKAEEEK